MSLKHIVFAILYLLVDVIWITGMSKVFYRHKIAKVQRAPLTFKLIPAVLAYVTLLITMFFVCIPLSEHYKKKTARLPWNFRLEPWTVFGLVGFCIYGVYNFTNGAIFKDYDSSFMLVDTIWGCVSFSIFGYIYSLLNT